MIVIGPWVDPLNEVVPMHRTIEIEDLAETSELVKRGIHNTAPKTPRESSASGETDDP